MNKNILIIQKLIKKMGQDPGPIDGIMGRKTKAAIQLALGVPKSIIKGTNTRLNTRSIRELRGVHPNMVRVIKETARTSKIPFIVTDGVRTVAEQRILVRKGFSKTMNSRHLKQRDGYSHAVDLAPLKGRTIDWNDLKLFEQLAVDVKASARRLGIKITWGGDWRSWKDRPHYQL